MLPFAYHLYHIPTKRHYYGIRIAKGCHPSELWVTYFSSSKVVKLLREQYGDDSFNYKVRKTFDSPKEAIEWEAKLLSRINAAGRNDWINRHNGGKKFSTAGNASWNKGLSHKQETRKKISEKRKPYVGKNHPMFGKKHSEQSKIMMSTNRIRMCGENNHFYGKTHTDTVKGIISEKNKGKISPRKGTILSDSEKKKRLEKINKMPKLICPHCNKHGVSLWMKRTHFNNCKLKPST